MSPNKISLMPPSGIVPPSEYVPNVGETTPEQIVDKFVAAEPVRFLSQALAPGLDRFFRGALPQMSDTPSPSKPVIDRLSSETMAELTAQGVDSDRAQRFLLQQQRDYRSDLEAMFQQEGTTAYDALPPEDRTAFEARWREDAARFAARNGRRS